MKRLNILVVVDGGGVGSGEAVCEELTAVGRKAVVVGGDEQALNAAVARVVNDMLATPKPPLNEVGATLGWTK